MVLPAKIGLTCFFILIATIFTVGLAKECDWDDNEWVVYTLMSLFFTSAAGMFVSAIWRIWIG